MEFFAKQLEFRQTRGLFIRLISKVLLKNTQILPLFGKNFETSIKTQKCCSCQRLNPKIPGITMKNRKKLCNEHRKLTYLQHLCWTVFCFLHLMHADLSDFRNFQELSIFRNFWFFFDFLVFVGFFWFFSAFFISRFFSEFLSNL